MKKTISHIILSLYVGLLFSTTTVFAACTGLGAAERCTEYGADGSTLVTDGAGNVLGGVNQDGTSYTPTTETPTTTKTSTGAAASGGCIYNDGETVSEALKRCKPDKVLTASGDDYKFDGGVRERVVQIANQLILVGSLLAVAAIVYGAIMYTISGGDDDRVKTAKNSLKFGIIGFVAMLLSFPIVNAIVRLFFATSGG